MKLGLGGPARELLQVRTDLEPDVDVAGLRKSLTSVPIGRVPWDRFCGQFEAEAEVADAAGDVGGEGNPGDSDAGEAEDATVVDADFEEVDPAAESEEEDDKEKEKDS